jgi:hypothetical protein
MFPRRLKPRLKAYLREVSGQRFNVYGDQEQTSSRIEDLLSDPLRLGDDDQYNVCCSTVGRFDCSISLWLAEQK